MNDDVSALIETAEEAMAQYLDHRGCFIYSATETFRKNGVLLYGINPGQNPDLRPDHCSNPILRDSIRGFRNQLNLICEQVWLTSKGNEYAKGGAPYQQRVRGVLEHIGHPDALVTNLAFFQAPSEEQLRCDLRHLFGVDRTGLQKHLEACWKVHQQILDLTRAQAIIALGDFTRQGLRKQLGGVWEEHETFRSGYSNWRCYRDEGTFDGRPIHIFTMPHLSIYRLTNHPRVLNWLKKGIARALGDAG